MSKMHKSVKSEKRILEIMIGMFYQHAVQKGNQCADCSELQAYAFKRIDKCKFGHAKPNCKDCPVHCYSPAMREKIREVMRYAGPRMIFRHPVMAIRHLLSQKKTIQNNHQL